MNKRFKQLITRNKLLIIISLITNVITILLLSIMIWALVATGILSVNSIPKRGAIQTAEPVASGTAAEESQIIATVDKVTPAVVSIVITKDMPVVRDYRQPYNLLEEWLNEQNTPPDNENESENQKVGSGSGFFVSSDGFIVTNKHVVADNDATYTVLTSDGNRYDAKVIAKDSTIDVAILKVSGNDFAYLSFADSDTLKVGQTTIAIGNALGEFQNSVSSGIVSGLLRSVTASTGVGDSEQLDQVIQTDAAINPGNSGGPLLDIKGNVVGVNVAVQGGAENIGFALPGNIVKQIADSVIKNGEIVRAYLGVRYIPLTDALIRKNNLTVEYGALVSRGETINDVAVISGSPADKNGITENDIILEIDEVKIQGNVSLATIIRNKSVGQTVNIKLFHKGQIKNIRVLLEKAP